MWQSGTPWFPGEIKTVEDAARALGSLQSFLAGLAEGVWWGPVPGAYFPFLWNVPTPAAATNFHQFVAPFDCRPIAVTGVTTAGSCTFRLFAQGVALMGTALSANTTGAGYYARGDFSLDLIEAGQRVRLRVDTNTSAANLGVILVVKNAGKIEPTEGAKSEDL